MRILHAIHTPRFSGAETLVATLTQLHSSQGHPSAVVAFNPTAPDFSSVIEDQEQKSVRWMHPRVPLKGFQRIAFYRKAANHFQPDVIFAHSVIPAAYARLAGLRPVISVLHDASENDYQSGNLRTIEFLLQHFSSGVIAVSETARQRYAHTFKRPDTIHVPNGIRVDTIRGAAPSREIIREGLGLQKNDIAVLQVGRINRIKQPHLSLAALVPLMQQNPNYRFFLAGLVEDLNYLEELKQFVRNNGLEAEVNLLGPRNDVAQLLTASDIYLMPSAREAHSVAMLEALASGIPIVASTIPSFQYAQTYAGVQLVDPLQIAAFTSAIASAITHITRHPRELIGLDIQDTAQTYLQFAKKCTS